MDIEGDGPIGHAGEHAVDFTIAQLVETSPQFRRWFTRQTTPYSDIEEYVGATIHATYAGEGESDIEYGFVSETDDRHLVLIENKIDAATQPNQFERYYNRGKFRTTRQDWDSFTVCLLAPENYVSETNRAAVDAVILYEDVIDELETLTHDSTAFFRSVFESALRKPVIADASETLLDLSEAVQSTLENDYLQPVQAGNKSLIFKSTHPDHHDAIRYNAYIVQKGEGGRTKIRLKIASSDAMTESERETIKSIVSAHAEALPHYEWMLDRKVDIGAKTLWHDDIAPDGLDAEYIQTVVDELAELVETLHPIFVDAELNRPS